MPTPPRSIFASLGWFVLILACGAATPPRLSAVTLAPLFSENAVLQRDRHVPIWGTADPGEVVQVDFQGQSKQASADESGRWKVILDPMASSASPSSLRVWGAGGGAALESPGILVGDVWLCSGQSNMAWPMVRTSDYRAEVAGADQPGIRYFEVERAASALPADSVKAIWQVCSAKTFTRASAVSYYFAREIHREVGVPVGVVVSAWGGTEIEPWIGDAALRADPAYPHVEKRDEARLSKARAHAGGHHARMERYLAAKAEALAQGIEFKARPPRPPEGEVSRKMPSALFNAMIHPLIPGAFRGILWYQGESNAGRHQEYRTLFPTLIRQWRRDFGQGDLPFFFVQLAAWNRTGKERTVAGLREAQMEALQLPHTGMAVAIDLGAPDTVHPPNKRDVGRRLALIALAKVYGKEGAFSGPLFREARVEGGKVRLRFDHTEGLTLANSIPNGFEIAGEDRHFVPAEATLEGSEILVSAKETPAPVAVRYAFVNYPSPALYNGAGLPAAPFRTDRWPLEESPSAAQGVQTPDPQDTGLSPTVEPLLSP